MKRILAAFAALALSAAASQALAADFSQQAQTLLDRAHSRHAGDPDGLASELRALSEKVGAALTARPVSQAQRGQLEFLRGTFTREAERALREKAGSRAAFGSVFGSADRADGACGNAARNAAWSAPSANLCSSGDYSPVYGQGPWYWSCDGRSGGRTLLCQAGRSGAQQTTYYNSSYQGAYPQASCGPANGAASNSQPAFDLCSSGTPSWVSGTGPWYWTCTSPGAQGASCSAPNRFRSECPAATMSSGRFSYPLPRTADGQSVVASSERAQAIPNGMSWGQRQYSCSNGTWWAQGFDSATVTCDAGYASNGTSCVADATHGSCGWAQNSNFAVTPSVGLCNAGVPGSVTADGYSWRWTCWGANDGIAVQCQANRTSPVGEGACGSAQGGTFEFRPTYNLCSLGEPSYVGDSGGSWSWTCGGNGGSANACWAWKSGSSSQWPTTLGGACGSAQGGTTSSRPQSGLCDRGTARWAQNSSNRWEWTCDPQDGGSSAACWGYRENGGAGGGTFQGACGSANGKSSATRPSFGLCSAGFSANMTGYGPWYWDCVGINGGSTVSCSSYKASGSSAGSAAACGSADGGTYSAAPSSSLCSAGTASWVSGSGPWYWTCYGTDGGDNASCQASGTANSSASCGWADGKYHARLPSNSTLLCASGQSAAFQATQDGYGVLDGWTWRCAGNLSQTERTCSARALR